MQLPRVLAVGAAALTLVVAGCGSSSGSGADGGSTAPAGGQTAAANPNAPEVNPAGDIPDSIAFVPAKVSGPFTVKVPEGWARSTDNGAVVYTDKLNAARIASMQVSSPPTVAQARSKAVPMLKRTVTNFKLGKVSTVTRPAGTGVKITYQAQGPADPVTGKRRTDAVERYAFAKNGTEVVLTLSGPVGADNVDPYKMITDSLRFTG